MVKHTALLSDNLLLHMQQKVVSWTTAAVSEHFQGVKSPDPALSVWFERQPVSRGAADLLGLEHVGEPCFGPHALLHPAKVLHVSITSDVLAEYLVMQVPHPLLGGCPSPTFHVAVSERQVAALAMPVGRQVPPNFRCAKNLAPTWRGNHKQRIENCRFVNVEKLEQVGGTRVVDVRFLLKTRQ